MVIVYFFINIIIFYLLLFLLVFIHELGHAAVAKLLRFRMFSIVLGYGKQLFEIETFGVKFRVNLVPLSGITVAIPQDDRAVRSKLWLYVLGGPLTHIIFITVAAFFISPSTFFIKTLGGIAILEVFLIANIWLLFNSLYPGKLVGMGPAVRSDGYHLFSLPFMDKGELANVSQYGPHIEAWDLLSRGQYEEAIIIYEKLLAENPEDINLRQSIAVARLNCGNYDGALELFQGALAMSEDQDDSYRLMVMNNIAWIVAVTKKAELYIEAENYSAKAYNSAPTFAPFLGTRGATLVRTGRVEEGIYYLTKAYKRHSERGARAANACFISIGEAERRDFKRAEFWLQKARLELPDYHLIKIAEAEVNDLRRSNT